MLWKDYPNGPWKNYVNPRELLKGGCLMILNGIKALINSVKFTGITINIGFIGLNFAGGSSKANILFLIGGLLMSKRNPLGTCALCKKENVELMQSHIIPKAVYKRIKTHEKSRFRELNDLNQIHQDGEKKPMLCHDCEEFFSRYERDFCIYFLDKYTSDTPFSNSLTENIDFYLLTVSWRILYDDLYVFNSFEDQPIRSTFEELENKLRRYLNATRSPQQQALIDQQLIKDYSDAEPMSFGEAIAFTEKIQRFQSPEDVSEIKNYIFTPGELGYTNQQTNLLLYCTKGYTFATPTEQYCCIMSLYLGWIFVTVYQPKRYIQINFDNTHYDKSISDIVKKEIDFTIQDLENKKTTNVKQAIDSGLMEKIRKRYLK